MHSSMNIKYISTGLILNLWKNYKSHENKNGKYKIQKKKNSLFKVVRFFFFFCPRINIESVYIGITFCKQFSFGWQIKCGNISNIPYNVENRKFYRLIRNRARPACLNDSRSPLRQVLDFLSLVLPFERGYGSLKLFLSPVSHRHKHFVSPWHIAKNVNTHTRSVFGCDKPGKADTFFVQTKNQ